MFAFPRFMHYVVSIIVLSTLITFFGPQGARANRIINPTLRWNTFMGSPTTDYGRFIAMDAAGNLFLAGVSDATWGSPLNPHAGSDDVFVAKFDTDGTLLWLTFLGSAGADSCRALCTDASGNVYLAGTSNATWGSAPINPHAGANDAFVAKLNGNGALQWNTFMGSLMNDYGLSMVIGGDGNLHVSGYSYLVWGAYLEPPAGGGDAFVATLNSSGVRLWHTFIGGSGSCDLGDVIAVDGSGNLYVAGTSDATWGAPIAPYTGGNDIFVARLNSAGALQWNTFLGSAGTDVCWAMDTDTGGSIYLTGMSNATWGTPIRPFAGGEEAFVAKMSATGAREWSTFLGSSTGDMGHGLTVGPDNSLYVAGRSDATWGAPATGHSGGYDAFAANLNSSGNLLWHLFMGADSEDVGSDIALDTRGNVYVAGYSNADWGKPLNGNQGLYHDAFVAKFVSLNLNPGINMLLLDDSQPSPAD